MIGVLLRALSLAKAGGSVAIGVASGIPVRGWIYLGLAGVVGVHLLRDHYETSQYTAEIARQVGIYQQERSARLEALAALTQVESNRDALALEVRRQNDAIGLLSLKATEQETAASLAAVRAFNQGRAAAEEMLSSRVPAPSSHEDATKAVNDILERLRTP